MAFIRDYAAMSGDPFSLRIPKRLRKLKVGRALGGIVRSVAAPVARTIIPGASTALDFARAYGYDLGDPIKKPPKRKSASAGPKAKAKNKKATRAAHSAKAAHEAKHGKGSGINIDWNAIGQAAASSIPVVGNVAGEIYSQVGGAKAAAAAAAGAGPGDFAFPGGAPMGFPGMKGHGFGHRRRSMNVTNVRALRRSLRRVDGFQKLVKRVEKMFPKMRHHVAAAPHRRKR
jgi:hypothetical protein